MVLPQNEIILATNNKHKHIEISQALPGYEIRTPRDLGIAFDCEETGATFLDNALLKARALHALCRRPVLADDSGLCVPALGGRPGVYSARFGQDQPAPPRNDAERNAYLLSLLPEDSRPAAFFVCAMVLLAAEYRIFTAQETVAGVIIHTPRGTQGFGYDPIFYLPERGLTVAEIGLPEKNSFSHRGRAVRRIRAVLESE